MGFYPLEIGIGMLLNSLQYLGQLPPPPAHTHARAHTYTHTHAKKKTKIKDYLLQRSIVLMLRNPTRKYESV